MRRPIPCVFALISVVAALACADDDEPDVVIDAGEPLVIDARVAGELSWYATCGDPVCREPAEPPPDDLCDDEVEGETCAERDASCALNDGCGGRLLCTDTDPTEDSCPISQRAAKRGVHYLTDSELDRLAGELGGLRLATYRYRDDDPTAPWRLGFMIDDVPNPSYLVRSRRDRVDLYGYASMAVAALKVQGKRIEQLERRLEQLERSCAEPR